MINLYVLYFGHNIKLLIKIIIIKADKNPNNK